MNTIRRAENKDIERITELLVQVNMVHHNARPDLFKGFAAKYTKDELIGILKDDSRKSEWRRFCDKEKSYRKN